MFCIQSDQTVVSANTSLSSSGSVQHLARVLEQQIIKNPFIPKPTTVFTKVTSRSRPVRRSTSFPQLPSQISKTSEIQAAACIQTLTPSPPGITQSSTQSSPFSISGACKLDRNIWEGLQKH